MQRGRVSLMQVCFLAMFFHVFLLGDGCTSGSVVRGVDVGTDHVAGERLSLFAEKNNEGISTACTSKVENCG